MNPTKDITGMLARPTATLRSISENPRPYAAVAVIIFATSFTVDFFSEQVPGGIWGQESFAAAMYIADYAGAALTLFLSYVVIFYVGRRLGGTCDFVKVFSVLSYCLIPTIIGSSMAICAGLAIDDDEQQAMYQDDGLAPSTILDFAGGNVLATIAFIIAMPFGIWSLILTIKAIRIMNDFGIGKSIGIIIISFIAIYAFIVVYDIFFAIVLISPGLLR